MMTATFKDRSGSTVAFLAAVVVFYSAAPSLASPADVIISAVLSSGAPSVKEAHASAFVNALSSVALRIKDNDLASYVSAAVTLRPDLVDKILAVALKSRSPEHRPSCDLIDRIVKAAVTAAPDAKKTIVRAVLDTSPWARECIVVAAEIDENEAAFLPSIDDTNNRIGLINPDNLAIGGGGNTQSPEQPPAP